MIYTRNLKQREPRSTKEKGGDRKVRGESSRPKYRKTTHCSTVFLPHLSSFRARPHSPLPSRLGIHVDGSSATTPSPSFRCRRLRCFSYIQPRICRLQPGRFGQQGRVRFF